MAPRSLLLYAKLAATSCVQIAIQFTYSIAFSLTGPLFSDQFGLPSAAVNVIFMLIGPLIGFFVQPIMGAVGDRCTFKFGRRRIFLLIGMCIDIIGTVLICAASFIDEMTFEEDSASVTSGSVAKADPADHIVGIILGITGIFIAFFGVNIMQAPSRAIVSDIFDPENQQDANLMINAFCGIASVCCFLISAFMAKSSANIYTIMFGLTAIVVVFATIPTLIFSKEQRFKPEDGKKGNIFQPFIDLFQAIKMIRVDIIFILLALMLGWFAYQPLSTNFTTYFQKTVYPAQYSDDGLQMALFMMVVFAVVQFFSVIIFPFITSIIGEITTFLLFQGLSAISYAMIVVINYTFPRDIYGTDEAAPAQYTSIALGFLSVIFPAMAFVQTNSLPYSMLKKVVSADRYGAYVGLLNCAVVVAQFLCSGLLSLIQLGVDSFVVGFYVATAAAVLCAAGSVVLYFVKTTEGTEGEKEKLVKEGEEAF